MSCIPDYRDKVDELGDTVKMMQSADYKERFKAEYQQTKIRYQKLHNMLIKRRMPVRSNSRLPARLSFSESRRRLWANIFTASR